MYVKPTFAVLLAFAIAACSDSDNATTPTDETSAPTDQNPSPDDSNAAPEGLNGTWRLTCRLDDPDAITPEYAITVATFEDDTVSIDTEYFDNDTCTAPATEMETIVRSIVFSGTTETPQGTATNIDFTLESFTLNGQAVTDGLDGDPVMDILLVDDDMLFSGLVVDDDDAAPTRPTELDLQNVFERQ